jgi:hypothetical protein
MVRHEAAEALGGIASDGVDSGEDAFDKEGREVVDVLGILREWAVKEHAPVVVRESCQVAIDMWEVGFLLLLPLLQLPSFILSSPLSFYTDLPSVRFDSTAMSIYMEGLELG